MACDCVFELNSDLQLLRFLYSKKEGNSNGDYEKNHTKRNDLHFVFATDVFANIEMITVMMVMAKVTVVRIALMSVVVVLRWETITTCVTNRTAMDSWRRIAPSTRFRNRLNITVNFNGSPWNSLHFRMDAPFE